MCGFTKRESSEGGVVYFGVKKFFPSPRKIGGKLSKIKQRLIYFWMKFIH